MKKMKPIGLALRRPSDPSPDQGMKWYERYKMVELEVNGTYKHGRCKQVCVYCPVLKFLPSKMDRQQASWPMTTHK